jgi:hypothetical protein
MDSYSFAVSSRAKSATTTLTDSPSLTYFSISSLTSASVSGLRARMATEWPFFASSIATSLPIPSEAPVTIAHLPWRRVLELAQHMEYAMSSPRKAALEKARKIATIPTTMTISARGVMSLPATTHSQDLTGGITFPRRLFTWPTISVA